MGCILEILMTLERLVLIEEDDEFERGMAAYEEDYVQRISFDFMLKLSRTPNSSHFACYR
jgi:hypothetical protein